MNRVSPRLCRSSFAAAILFAGAALPAAQLKIDGFLKIDDIKGESTSAAHEDQIEIYSWSHVVRSPADAAKGATAGSTARMTSDPQEGGEVVEGVDTVKSPDAADPAVAAKKGKRRGKVALGPVVFTKHLDQSSPAMRTAPPPSGKLTLVARAGACTAGARYPGATLNASGEVYRLDKIVVTGCAPAPSSGGVEMESWTIVAEHIQRVSG
jgi:type VI protein secretion system component Hcp